MKEPKKRSRLHFLLLPKANFILEKMAIPAVINSPVRFFRFHFTQFFLQIKPYETRSVLFLQIKKIVETGC